MNINYKYECNSIIRTDINEIFKANMWVGEHEVEQQVCVDQGEIFACDMFLKSFSHVNYLPLKLMDSASNVLIHNVYDLTLVDYLTSLKQKKIKPIMIYNVPGTKNTYSYVPQEYRKLVKGLIKFVLDMYKKNLSLRCLSLDNLSVINNEIKIWGVRFTETTDASKDFGKVYEVVQEMFNIGGNTGGKIPPDFQDLRDKLVNFRYFI